MRAMAWTSDRRRSGLLSSEAARHGLWLVVLWCLIGLTAGLLAAVTPRDAVRLDPTVIGSEDGSSSAGPAAIA